MIEKWAEGKLQDMGLTQGHFLSVGPWQTGGSKLRFGAYVVPQQSKKNAGGEGGTRRGKPATMAALTVPISRTTTCRGSEDMGVKATQGKKAGHPGPWELGGSANVRLGKLPTP